MNHPNEGILYPEYLDAEEVLSYASGYLHIVSKLKDSE